MLSMFLPGGALTINWKLKTFHCKTICSQFDIYLEGKFPGTPVKNPGPQIPLQESLFLSQLQRVPSKSLVRVMMGFFLGLETPQQQLGKTAADS